MIDWCNFRNGEIAVNCRTEKEATEFIEECYTHNIASDRNDTAWEIYKENTCYLVSDDRLYFTTIHNGSFYDLEIVRYWENADKMESNTDKVELKEGMVVELKNGNRYLIREVSGELILSGNKGWLRYTYNRDLTEVDSDSQNGAFDIAKVYRSTAHIMENLFDDNYLTCIWRRENPKKMTLAEISEALGYEVELV